jgi:hypothetical protein
MGAANPASAGARARELARRLGWHGLPIATVSGDDVYDVVRQATSRLPKPARRSRR